MSDSPHMLPYDKDISANGAYVRPSGLQRRITFAAGDTAPQQIASVLQNHSLARFSVIGDVDIEATYGTGPTVRVALTAPLETVLPGNAQLSVTPRTTPTEAVVTLHPVWFAPAEAARSFVDASGGAVALPNSAKRATALAASTVTIRGTAVALAVAESIPLVSGSVLTSGIAIVEHAI